MEARRDVARRADLSVTDETRSKMVFERTKRGRVTPEFGPEQKPEAGR